jgi:hypothetical protein
MPSNDVLTRNGDGDLAVRTVSATESSTVVNPNDVYTRDEDGNLAIRTVGGSGEGQVTSVNGKTGAVVTINDNSTTSTTESWSASKLNTMIGNIETLLSQI